MAPVPNMEVFLGKDIKDVCGNGFKDPGANHCAHFVSHALGIDFSFNCKQFVGGNKPPANIRVHEIFAQCPRVGKWDDADTAASQLVFVTRKDVVNLTTKTMQNIPQKHIGVFHNNMVYHYSNSQDKVVKQSVEDFLDRFQAAYSGDQGLFFGEFPGATLELSVSTTGAGVPHPFAFSLRKDGNKWMAQRVDQAGAAEFYVGNEIKQPSKKFFGIFQPVSLYYGPTYDADAHAGQIDHWAYLLDVTAFCESKLRLNLINTYDRARFTFGFYQLAAHTPRDNLILFFRAALNDEVFRQLFPDLRLIGGKVFRVSRDGTATDLEEETFDSATGEHQLKHFMAYLNPQRLEIDEQEVLQSARVMWWANTSPACADLQAKVAAAILQKKMSERYHRWYDLDGRKDVICAIIADIHHQGRGSKKAVKQALQSSNKVKALLKIGKDSHPERVKALEERIGMWTDAGKMGNKVYRAGLNEFN